MARHHRRLDAGPLLARSPAVLPADPASRRAWLRAAASGWVTVPAADVLAVRVLGLHPSLVFGPAWWTA